MKKYLYIFLASAFATLLFLSGRIFSQNLDVGNAETEVNVNPILYDTSSDDSLNYKIIQGEEHIAVSLSPFQYIETKDNSNFLLP